MNNFFKYLNSMAPISKDIESEIIKIVTLTTYPAGTILCKMGEIPSQVYFLKSGIVRGYTISPKGTFFNRLLFQKGEFMASLSALIQKKEAEFALECLTDSEVIETNYHELLKLGKEIPEILIIYIKLLEEKFIKLEISNHNFVTLNATERYLKLRNRIPGIDNLIPQYHIASHLGITPIQLSRIRKSLSTSK